ncbi:MAG: hypothetical protein EOO14_00525 [Chitinophagaceae bacterium]|nr:MAG: hypothetical protein EOO14_00525 [Chitinophagaceae bacterium]
MRKTILALLLTVFVCTAFAQPTTTSATLSRWSQSKGTFILWYGSGKVVKEYAAFQAAFDDSYTEQEVVNELKKKVFKSSTYIGYEFKANFDCNAAQGFIARQLNVKMKEVQDLRVGNCTQLSYDFKKTVEPSVDKAAFAVINPVIAERERSLLSDGWQKVYSDYGSDALATEVKLKPGHTYTGLGGFYTGVDTGVTAKILVTDSKSLLTGFETFARDNAVLLELNDFYPQKNQSTAIFSVHPTPEKPYKSAIAVFEKPLDFKRDFFRLLDARDDGFSAYKTNKRRMNTDGFYSYSSAISLGVKKARINETKTTMEYMLEMDFMDPETLTFLDNLLPVLQELPAKGYKAEDYKNKSGGSVTEITKDGEGVMMLVSYPAKNEAYFYIFKSKK